MASVPNWKLVGPEEKKKLAPLVRHYMSKPHPFTACVRDNTKRFGPERAKRVCAVVKDIGHGGTGWRKGGKVKEALEGGSIDTLLADLAELTALSELSEKALSGGERKALPKGAFVFPAKAPGSGSYPIHDLAHARNALARSSGKPEEAAVKAAVYARYPALKKGKLKESDPAFLPPLTEAGFGSGSDPDEHPRDILGQWRKAASFQLLKLPAGVKLKLDDGRVAKKNRYGDFLTPDGEDATDAVHDELARHLRTEARQEIMGEKPKQTAAQALANIGKGYIAPPEVSGPYPSARRSWVDDV